MSTAESDYPVTGAGKWLQENCLNGDCEETDERMERIYEYLDGALSRRDIEEVQAHLDDCPDCASVHDLECIIRATVRRSCVEQAPETLKVNILEKISELRVEAGHGTQGSEHQ